MNPWDQMTRDTQGAMNRFQDSMRPPMYGQSSFTPAPLGQNPFHMGMQNMAMQSMFAPQQIANNVNGAMQNYQAARLYNAPQETARMGIEQKGNNFNQLMSILPPLLGAIGGGILSPGEQRGFQTNYGAGATMGGGGGNPHGDDGGKTFHGMLRQYM